MARSSAECRVPSAYAMRNEPIFRRQVKQLCGLCPDVHRDGEVSGLRCETNPFQAAAPPVIGIPQPVARLGPAKTYCAKRTCLPAGRPNLDIRPCTHGTWHSRVRHSALRCRGLRSDLPATCLAGRRERRNHAFTNCRAKTYGAKPISPGKPTVRNEANWWRRGRQSSAASRRGDPSENLRCETNLPAGRQAQFSP